ncbi:NAD-glutamate dehydrogenase [Hyphomicrobiales bacterium]|nr:NAD-glutamate dehydrogenase [Hyphomicrobiales bacterium]CAH1700827.1 NAD-glutamate dehydrogenase [Hyphomicrobiales bacterium]CAI0344702.1 NAD-glutamate dehydrogenase [Hyphomicrobiales bacterium]
MSVIATNGPAAAPGVLAGSVDAPRLSTDFLNRYSEALMLIEMAAVDDEVLADLQAWQGSSYREHFRVSPLRCAASALMAYDRVAPSRVSAFEAVCLSMTRLVRTVTALLAEAPQPAELPIIVEVASDVLRRQIGRATQFINANGAVDIDTLEDAALQAQVDALLAR